MDKFFHVRMLIGIILSLSIAHLFKGVAKLIEHPKRATPYWVHLLWVFYIFLMLISFWWWEFRLKLLAEWTFLSYFFVVSFIILFYVVCSLLFPDDLKEYNGFEDYYYSRRKWFFSILAVTYLVDIGDTLLKGKGYLESLGTEYLIRAGIHFILCVLAIKVRNEWFHALLAIFFIVYMVSWILRMYFVQ